MPFASFLEYGGRTWLQTQKSLKEQMSLHRSDAAEVLPPLDRPCDQDGGSPYRMPRQLLFGELEQGHRRQGRPCKSFKDTLKAGLKWCGIPSTELVATALDRRRRRTQSASSALEEERLHLAQSARERRHLEASVPATAANFQCPVCARLCKSRIGLRSHPRTHR